MQIKLHSFFVLSLPSHLMETFFTISFNFNKLIFVYVISIRLICDGEIYILTYILCLRTRFPCSGSLDFWKNIKKKNLKYGQSMDSDAIAFNFLKKLDSRLVHVGFKEISFLKSHDVINSNSWFLAILKEFSCLPLFKLFFS